MAMQLKGDYAIPFFLSFDRDLCQAIKEFPVKAAVIDTRSGEVISLPEVDCYGYFKEQGCEEIVLDFFSAEKKNERVSGGDVTPAVILSRIRSEYRELCGLLGRT